MRNIGLMLISLLVLAGLIGGFANKFTGQAASGDRAGRRVPAPPAVASTESSRPAQSLNTLAVPRDRSGHFRVDANIGGRSLDFLVDTGATSVALTKRDADRLGITLSARDYKIPMQTANGIVRAAPVRLAAIRVGQLMVQDVDAVVIPQGALAQNLLGMSFLNRLRRFEFRTGQLVLEQ